MDLTGLLMLVLIIALIGFCVWLVIKYIPMPEIFKTAIVVIVVVVIILWLIRGISGGIPTLRLN